MDTEFNKEEDLDLFIQKLLATLHNNVKKKSLMDFFLTRKEQNITIDCLDELSNIIKNKVISSKDAKILFEFIQRILIIMKKTKQLQNVKWQNLLEIMVLLVKKIDYPNIIYKRHHPIDAIIYSIFTKFPKDILENLYLSQKNFISFHLITKYYASRNQIQKVM